MFKMRILFEKKDDAAYISHLDLIRTMKGAFSRADIPIYYSEGFNPHPKMVFSLPLSIGCESVCEYLDIKLNSPMDEKELLERLNAQFPPELQFTDVYERTTEFSTIDSAEYVIKLYESVSSEEVSKALEGPVTVTKKSKKGMIEVDLKEGTRSAEVSKAEDHVLIKVRLCAKQEGYVNPDHLIKGIGAKLGLELWDYDILRCAVYNSKGEIFR